VLWTYTVITSKRGICTPDVQFSDCCFSLDVRLSVVLFLFLFSFSFSPSLFIFPSDQRSIVQPPCLKYHSIQIYRMCLLTCTSHRVIICLEWNDRIQEEKNLY